METSWQRVDQSCSSKMQRDMHTYCILNVMRRVTDSCWKHREIVHWQAVTTGCDLPSALPAAVGVHSVW